MTEVLIDKGQNETMYREAYDLNSPTLFPWSNNIKITNVRVGRQWLGGVRQLGKQQGHRTLLFLFLIKDFEEKPTSNDPQCTLMPSCELGRVEQSGTGRPPFPYGIHSTHLEAMASESVGGGHHEKQLGQWLHRKNWASPKLGLTTRCNKTMECHSEGTTEMSGSWQRASLSHITSYMTTAFSQV